MVDIQGRTYNTLPTAWRFQQQHVASCKCRPDPWEPQAMARHTKYAKLKSEGRLDSYLKRASRKVRRNSRRASIGHVVVNSSFSSGETVQSVSKPKVRRVSKTAKRSKPRRQQRTTASFGNARGFSSKSYKAKSYAPKSYAPKSYTSARRSNDFRRAFGDDR